MVQLVSLLTEDIPFPYFGRGQHGEHHLVQVQVGAIEDERVTERGEGGTVDDWVVGTGELEVRGAQQSGEVVGCVAPICEWVDEDKGGSAILHEEEP